MQVICKTNSPQNTGLGVYVKLLEYDDMDGMIPPSEISRRRIRSVQKIIRIGSDEPVVVIRVDKENGQPPPPSSFSSSYN